MTKEMVDICGPEIVEVHIRWDQKVLWVNVEGQCVLRICRIEKFELKDDRQVRT